MSIEVGHVSIYLCPALRGAPDSLRTPLHEVVGRPGRLLVASQQVSDRPMVEVAVAALAGSGARGRFLVEERFLRESEPVAPDEVWASQGHFEDNRQCFMALLRAGAEVRPDTVGTALQHANFVVSQASTGPAGLITSANLSPGSIDGHYNWLLRTDHEQLTDVLETLFERAWDGDFRDASVSASLGPAAERVRLEAGASAEALSLLAEQIRGSQRSVELAFFNISSSSPVVDELVAAQRRGVTIRGVVDGDQSHQPWDAVPALRDAGIDLRYYPGALTGAAGRRMHYKMAAIDSRTVYLGTANISSSAQSSLEIGVSIDDRSERANAFVRAQIERLWPLARVRAFARDPS